MPDATLKDLILSSAEFYFAKLGYEGTSLEKIALHAGTSKHNLLHYFPKKELLYRAVLDNVLEPWLNSMKHLKDSNSPEISLKNYIENKMIFSMERPYGTQVFTREVSSRALRYSDVLKSKVTPILQQDIHQFEIWANSGLIKYTNFKQLIFFIWAASQAWADLAPEFAILIGKEKLEASDFQEGTEMLLYLVMSGLSLNTNR